MNFTLRHRRWWINRWLWRRGRYDRRNYHHRRWRRRDHRRGWGNNGWWWCGDTTRWCDDRWRRGRYNRWLSSFAAGWCYYRWRGNHGRWGRYNRRRRCLTTRRRDDRWRNHHRRGYDRWWCNDRWWCGDTTRWCDESLCGERVRHTGCKRDRSTHRNNGEYGEETGKDRALLCVRHLFANTHISFF